MGPPPSLAPPLLAVLPVQSADYHPHGFCFLWEADLLWTHVAADGLTAVAYYSIPVGLLYVTRKRRDIPFDWMFVAFAAFILACGTTHLMAIWNLWHGDYWASAWVKVATAGASVATAVLMIPMIPRVIALPSPAALRLKNGELERAHTRIAELNRELRHRVQELESANADLEAFSHSVSHDLKAPLRSMEGFATAILEDCRHAMDSACIDYATRVSRGASRLSTLIDDLLRYSKVALTPVPPGTVDLRTLLSDVSASLQGTIDETGASLELDLQVEQLYAHGGTLAAALTNLIANALTYVPEDRAPRIKVTTGWVSDDVVGIAVEDNGIGIEPENQERIFRIFERLHGVDSGYAGTGIGLAVVVRAMERLGGSVRVESTPGVGSRFCLRVPAGRPT